MPAEKVLYLSSPHPQSDTSLLPGKDVKVDGQAVHAVAAVLFEYAPAGHGTHISALLAPETPENAPAGHNTHAFTLLAPVTPEYAPAGHGTHTVDPAELAYMPAAQLIQTLSALAPTVLDALPTAQTIHALDPVTVLYCPAGHAVQVAPFAPVCPASHVQLLMNPLEAGAREFSGHRLQFALPSGDHCPSGHGRHVSVPVAP